MSENGSRLRVLHAITGLEVGGAELILSRLLPRLDPERFESAVVSLTTEGVIGPRIREEGVPVTALGLGVPPSPRGLWALRRAIRDFAPDVLQTWLLHSNVLAGVAGRIARVPVVWGVHITDVRREVHGSVAVASRGMERRLARPVPARIVACSHSSAAVMRELHYPEGKLVTIPNGFDVARYHPDAEDRAAVRSELGIPGDARVVGHVARFHPMKDHRNLLRAAAHLEARLSGAHLVLCGEGVSTDNPELAEWAGELQNVHLLGRRDDVDRVMRAFDVLALSSVGAEALPLVIGEAMASGVPVVATDLGDAAELIGDPARVVPVSDPEALAQALARVLALPDGELRALGTAARERIERDFDLDAMVGGYAAEWAAASGRSA
jgi:glycosyltransferase involved in cell wall biosynthesis